MKTRILIVSTPVWTATCRWVYLDSKWEPVIFDKELVFLKGLKMEQCRDELKDLGCQYQWGPVEDRPAPAHDGLKESVLPHYQQCGD